MLLGLTVKPPQCPKHTCLQGRGGTAPSWETAFVPQRKLRGHTQSLGPEAGLCGRCPRGLRTCLAVAARPRRSEAHRAPPLAVTLSQPWSSSLSVPRVGPDLVGGRCPHPHFLLITVTSSWAVQLLPPPGSGFQETATPGSRLHRCTGRSQMRRQQADVQAEAAMLLASVRVCPVPDAPLELGRGLPRTRLADPRLWWSAHGVCIHVCPRVQACVWGGGPVRV